jgi:hypothetical protein
MDPEIAKDQPVNTQDNTAGHPETDAILPKAVPTRDTKDLENGTTTPFAG